jgi:hypothetical protein
MRLFKPITDMSSGITGLLQSARGLLDKAGGEGLGQGLKGVVQGVLDLNLDGFIQSLDAMMGTGVMRLTVEGNTDGVETVVRFRNYALMRLEEVRDMRDIVNEFISHDPEVVNRALENMQSFLEGKEPDMVCSERDEGLKQEINRLRKMVRQMSTFLDGEDALLADEGAAEQDAGGEAGTAKTGVVPDDPSVARIVIGTERRTIR